MTQDRPIHVQNGWTMLPVNLLMLFGGMVLFCTGVAIASQRTMAAPGSVLAILSLLGAITGLICLTGHFTLQPNEACVISLFGPYLGTVRESGFYWYNPFATKRKISLRTRNFEGARLKVNDKVGNPIEIAAVTVWRVADAAQATFDVDDYVNYVSIQSETALRHLANSFAYDHGEEHETTWKRQSKREPLRQEELRRSAIEKGTSWLTLFRTFFGFVFCLGPTLS